MARRRGGLNATAGLRSLVVVLYILINLAGAYQFVPNSPCESVCREGTLTEDAVCLDEQYQNTKGGSRLQGCVGCLLNSTAVDTANNRSDVEWGLYTLRYTLSSCMFGIPVERVSISSPCQVSCQRLNSSVSYQITNDTESADPGLDFCNAGLFDDLTINNCAFCYSMIPQQLFVANFMQALHIECRQPPVPGAPFFPTADAIFNETLIAGPSPPSNNSGGHGGLHGSALALAIALPIVGGILIFGFGCWCCFLFTRRRRRRMAASGRMDKVHEAHDGGSLYTPVTPKQKHMWGGVEPPREMTQFEPSPTTQPSPRLNRWSGGHGQYPPPAGAVVGGGGDVDEDGTPLRSSFQRDDVGPGPDQHQDHELHEQYFGVADGGEGGVVGAGQSHTHALSTEQRYSGDYAGISQPEYGHGHVHEHGR